MASNDETPTMKVCKVWNIPLWPLHPGQLYPTVKVLVRVSSIIIISDLKPYNYVQTYDDR